MAKSSRAYTRKELETLRRADLQNLYKIHGLKGANAKTEILLDGLVSLFESPAFIKSNAIPSSSKPRPYARPLKSAVSEVSTRSKQTGRKVGETRKGPRAVRSVVSESDGKGGVEVGSAEVSQVSEIESATESTKELPGDGRITLPQSTPSAILVVPPTPVPAPPPPLSSTAPKSTQLVPAPSQSSVASSSTVAYVSSHAQCVPLSQFTALCREVKALAETVDKLRRKQTVSRDEVEVYVLDREADMNDRMTRFDDAWANKLTSIGEELDKTMARIEQNYNEKLAAMQAAYESRFGPMPPVEEDDETIRASTSLSSLPAVQNNLVHASSSANQSPRSSKRARRDPPIPVSARAGVEPSTSQSPRKRSRLNGKGVSKQVAFAGTESEIASEVESPSVEPQTPSPTDIATLTSPEIVDRSPRPSSTKQASAAGKEVAPPPRTPSPSHQGVPADNSKTPAFGPDYFAHLPPIPGSSNSRFNSLPFPIFPTTPKPPTDPTSPTTDVPQSAGTSRQTATAASMLTPGRPPKTRLHAPRWSMSKRPAELSTVREGTEESAIGKDAELTTGPSLFGPELARSITPPQLSPSPSIGGSDFNYTPFPAPPSGARRREISNPTMPVSQITPPRKPRASSTPAGEYMDVALHGLPHQNQSPSVMATPGHRTMLGTERYRDTRFGDMPVVQWGSPSVDLGYPATPM